MKNVAELLEMVQQAKIYKDQMNQALQHKLVIDFWSENGIIGVVPFPKSINLQGKSYTDSLIIDVMVLDEEVNLPLPLQNKLKNKMEEAHDYDGGPYWNISRRITSETTFSQEWFDQL